MMPITDSGNDFVETGSDPNAGPEFNFESGQGEDEAALMGDRQEFLRWLLDYEIRGSERYRRFLSILLIASNRDGKRIERLKESFRRSDEIVPLDRRRAAILLRETNVEGTLIAINRYKSFHNVIHLRFAVVCYPTDGWNANFILDSANARIERAMHGPAGAVVC